VALALAVALSLLASCGSDSGSSSSSGSAPSSTAWLNEPITDTSGRTFTVADLAGTPVFVEDFATWCTNCHTQLGKTQQAAAEAGGRAVFLALSVETDLDPAKVADYARKNGFDDIRFAVMSPELLAAIKDAYGTGALNPPSTPKFVVAADGTPGPMQTGFEEPAEIADRLGTAGA